LFAQEIFAISGKIGPQSLKKSSRFRARSALNPSRNLRYFGQDQPSIAQKNFAVSGKISPQSLKKTSRFRARSALNRSKKLRGFGQDQPSIVSRKK
jgi:hypothetical protein